MDPSEMPKRSSGLVACQPLGLPLDALFLSPYLARSGLIGPHSYSCPVSWPGSSYHASRVIKALPSKRPWNLARTASFLPLLGAMQSRTPGVWLGEHFAASCLRLSWDIKAGLTLTTTCTTQFQLLPCCLTTHRSTSPIHKVPSDST